MSQFLLRMAVAVILLTLEVVLATALVAPFTQWVENLKTWFRNHYRVTLAVIFPVLLATNVGLTFIITDASADSGAAAGGNPGGTTVPELDTTGPRLMIEPFHDSEAPAEAEAASDGEVPASPAPIPGYAADETMEGATMRHEERESGGADRGGATHAIPEKYYEPSESR